MNNESKEKTQQKTQKHNKTTQNHKNNNNATVTSLVLWGVDSGPVTRGPSNDVTMSGN